MSLSWLPNAISIMRIALIMPILLLFVNNEFGWALALFLVAGLSDGVDGYLAKNFGWSTRLYTIAYLQKLECIILKMRKEELFTLEKQKISNAGFWDTSMIKVHERPNYAVKRQP